MKEPAERSQGRCGTVPQTSISGFHSENSVQIWSLFVNLCVVFCLCTVGATLQIRNVASAIGGFCGRSTTPIDLCSIVKGHSECYQPMYINGFHPLRSTMC